MMNKKEEKEEISPHIDGLRWQLKEIEGEDVLVDDRDYYSRLPISIIPFISAYFEFSDKYFVESLGMVKVITKNYTMEIQFSYARLFFQSFSVSGLSDYRPKTYISEAFFPALLYWLKKVQNGKEG